jgi:membrane-associated phospholipid phosphatase
MPVPLGATLALTFLGNDKQGRAGRQAADAILVTGAATELLKRMTRADRPDNPYAHDGFPSGHASLNFAFARAVASQYHGWGNWAYLFAAGVTWSRVRREDHSWAQALAGAGLGWYVADRSVHSRGGLLHGLILAKERSGLQGTVAPAPGGAGLGVGRLSW